MSHENRPPGATLYRICISGRLDSDWSDWFSGFSVASDGAGGTVLTGLVVDQSALLGLLARLVNLRLELRSVERLDQCDTRLQEDSNGCS